jgi:hypothetical protein
MRFEANWKGIAWNESGKWLVQSQSTTTELSSHLWDLRMNILRRE